MNQTGDFYLVEDEVLKCNDKKIIKAAVVDNSGKSICIFLDQKVQVSRQFTFPGNTLLLSYLINYNNFYQ